MIPYEQGVEDALRAAAMEFRENFVGALEGVPGMDCQTLIGVDDSEFGVAIFYVPLSLKEEIEKLIDSICGKSVDDKRIIREYGDRP